MKKFLKTTFFSLLTVSLYQIQAFAQNTGEVQRKLHQAGTAIQGVVIGLAVVVGIIAAGKVVIKALPNLDDPHVKEGMWKSVGAIFLGVGAVAAATWICPWIFSLFS